MIMLNHMVQERVIDSSNFKRIKSQLDKEGIVLLGQDDEGDDIKIDIYETDYTWTVYSKIMKHIYYNVFTMSQQFKYGDFYAKKQTGDFLLRCGIDGMKYPLGSKTNISTSHGYEGFAYVIYDSDSIVIEKVEVININ